MPKLFSTGGGFAGLWSLSCIPLWRAQAEAEEPTKWDDHLSFLLGANDDANA